MPLGPLQGTLPNGPLSVPRDRATDDTSLAVAGPSSTGPDTSLWEAGSRRGLRPP